MGANKMTDTYVEKLIINKFLTLESLENIPKAIQFYLDNKENETPLVSFEAFMPVYPDGATDEEKEKIDGPLIIKFVNWVNLYEQYFDTEEGDQDDDILFEAVKLTEPHLTTTNHKIKLYNEQGELYDFSVYPNVAFQNEDFERPLDDKGNNKNWYELFFVPDVPNQIELGTTGRSRWVGIMQVNVCVPKTWGTEELYDRYDEIASLFRSGLILEGVRIVKTYRTVSFDDNDFFCLPVTIEWQADLDR